MKIIAVMNQKGGVGKTMTSAAIAYILGEEMKKRVLIADADQQGNVSMLYGVYDPEGIGVPELLEAHQATGGAYSTKDLIQQTAYATIQIIPANGYLMHTNAELLLAERGKQISRFEEAMNEVRTEYDYCIADCGLLLDMTVMNVLAAADMVIVPAKIGGFEIDAINNMTKQLRTFRDINDDIRMKVLLTMKQKNKTTLQVESWIRDRENYECFDTAVRRSIVAEKSTIEKLPLPAFSRNCTASKDYRAVCQELVNEFERGEENGMECDGCVEPEHTGSSH